MTLGQPVTLDAASLIELAGQAAQLSVGRWSLALLQRAYPTTALETLLALPVGSRDRLVLAVRARLLPGPLRSEPLCDACGAVYELALDPRAYGLGPDSPWPDPQFRPVVIVDHPVLVRPVNLSDLLATEAVALPQQAASVIAARVLAEDPGDIPLDGLAAALEAIDPAADVWLQTLCPECGASQSVGLDAVYFVAHEIRQLSGAILRDVVTLARTFHWSERDILALPDQRRAYYVAEALA